MWIFTPLALRGVSMCLLLLQLRKLVFHLDDQHLKLLLALLAGVGIDIAGVLLTVDPHG